MTRVRVRGWWLAPLAVAAIAVTPWPGWAVEAWYSRAVFPMIQRGLTTVSNLTPVAIIDVGLVLAAVFLVSVAIRFVTAGRARGWFSALWEGGRRLVRVAAVLALLFLLAWGLNYRRVPLEVALGGGPDMRPAPLAIVTLAREAARAAGETRPAAQTHPTGYADIAARLEPSFQLALQRLGQVPLSIAGRPKHSPVLTPFFTAAGVTGMVNPIALESILHPDLLPFERPMVLAHEWAHLAGFADEADASAVAWLACVLGDPGLAYSAHFSVVLETATVLPRGEWPAIRATLDPGVVADIQALAKRLTRQQPVVRDTAFKVYDGYLRSNRVEDGVRSYSRMLRVLVTPGMRRALNQAPRTPAPRTPEP